MFVSRYRLYCLALLVLALLVPARLLEGSTVHADAPKGVSITAEVSGIRNNKGLILAALFCQEDGFPDGDKACRRAASEITRRRAKVVFNNVPKGVYAVSLIHDENNNRKLETNWIGIPDEGVGISRNAKGTMGPPDYDDAKFTVRDKSIVLRIRMEYY